MRKYTAVAENHGVQVHVTVMVGYRGSVAKTRQAARTMVQAYLSDTGVTTATIVSLYEVGMSAQVGIDW